MKKIQDFFKSNLIIVKWTIWYFLILWLILRFVFNFDMFSAHYWWKFFHATLHGFGGFVFGLLVYTAIPIYIATTAVIYRKKELVITIPFVDKVFNLIRKLFPKKQVAEKQIEAPIEEPASNEPPAPQYPDDMPLELRVPYERAKNHMSLTGAVSVYNQTKTTKTDVPNSTETDNISVPIPTDFDLSESFDTNNETIPVFHDINFDEVTTEPENETLENNTTKYFASKNIEFETYKQFVATEKYVIYEHNDEDFWIMDENVWFASGQQIDSPINELMDLAKQNDLIPVLYLKSQNIMDIEGTINNFKSMGIHVIKDLDELN